MGRIQVSKDLSGRIIVSSPYDPLLVEKVKSIDGRRWHSIEKHWSFPQHLYPHPLRERVRVRGIISKIWRRDLLGYAHSKTTEIYTHVSTQSIGKIKSPLGSSNLKKGGDE